MQAINDKQWAMMRSAVTAYFPDKVSFYSVTKSYDRFGNLTTASGLMLTVSGQFNNPSGKDREILEALKAAGNQFDESTKFSLPYGTQASIDWVAVSANSIEWNVAYINQHQTFTAATDCLLTRSLINGRRVER